jgi:hypothetical protein
LATGKNSGTRNPLQNQPAKSTLYAYHGAPLSQYPDFFPLPGNLSIVCSMPSIIPDLAAFLAHWQVLILLPTDLIEESVPCFRR